MSTWIKLLPLELNDISAFIEPTDKTKKGEKVVGAMSTSLKQLFTLWMSTERAAAETMLDIKYSGVTAEKKAKMGEMREKANALQSIFWIAVKDELSLWGGDTIGARTGYQIVEFKAPPEPPFMKFFRGIIDEGGEGD